MAERIVATGRRDECCLRRNAGCSILLLVAARWTASAGSCEPAASGGARKNSIQYAANASSNFPPVSTGSRYEYRYKVGVPVQGRSTGKR